MVEYPANHFKKIRLLKVLLHPIDILMNPLDVAINITLG